MLHGGKPDRSTGGVARSDAAWHRDDQPGRQIHEVAAEAVDMETHDAADILAKIVATFLAGLACSASHRAVHNHGIPRSEPRDARAYGSNLAGSLHSHYDRHFA